MTTLNDCTLPLRQKDVCVTSKFRDIPIQFSDFLSFREFLRFRLARSERNAGFWLASANPLRRQSSRTRTQPFTSSARLSHYSGWRGGCRGGGGKNRMEGKKLPTIPWKKERNEKNNSLSLLFLEMFLQNVIPEFFCSSISLSLLKKRGCVWRSIGNKKSVWWKMKMSPLQLLPFP